MTDTWERTFNWMGIDQRTGKILLREGREARSKTESLMRAEDKSKKQRWKISFFFPGESCSVTELRDCADGTSVI